MIFQTQIFDLGEDIIFFNFPIKEFAVNQRAANNRALIPFHLHATCQVSPLR